MKKYTPYEPIIHIAIRNLYPEAISISGSIARDKDEIEINTDQSSIDAEITRLQAEYDAQEYARDRADAYPSIGDQLDMQYHDQLNGTTTWKDAVAKVKADNPKTKGK